MNEYGTVERLKAKVAKVLSNALICQAEEGLKHSLFIHMSEPKIPIELLKEYSK